MIFNDMLLSGGLVTGEIIVTITGKSSTITYDAQSHSVSGYTVSISDPEYTTNDFDFSGTASASRKNQGTTSMGLTAAQFTNNNPKFKNVTFVVTDGFVKINRKAVTVTAAAKSKTYDNNASTDPALTATVSGTLGSDTVTYTISRKTGQNVGSYTITPTGDANQGNYNVSYVTATFKINRKAVTVKADNKSKTYGSSDPTLTATVTGTIGSDTVTYTLSRASGNNAGTYTITPSGDANQGNYSVTYQTGTFTINRKVVTVKADNKSKTYGASDPTFTATVTGTLGSDTVSYTITRASGSNVGTYTITPSGNATQGNYSVSYETGTLTISRKAITVKADNKSKTYGASDPTLTATVTGLVGSDTVSYTLSRASGSNVGTYTITPTGNATQGNYTVTYQTGTFTINRKSITVKADNKSKTYGESDPTLTATVTGLVGSDTVNYSLSRASGNNAGTYTITATGNATQGNYSVTYQNGTFTIRKKSVTVTIVGNNNSYYYTGSSITVSGYSVTSISDNAYTTSDFTVSNTSVSRTAVGTSYMGLTAADKGTKTNYEPTFNITDGYITIIAQPTTGTITFTIQYQPGYVEIKDFYTDNVIYYRYCSAGSYTVRNVAPSYYVSTNEEAGNYTLKQVTAGSTVDVTGILW